MDPISQHVHVPDASFDGGDLDCGNGLLLLLRKNLDVLEPGQLLEILSSESSVEEDLPAWCRLTKNELVSWTKKGKQRSFLVAKGAHSPAPSARTSEASPARPAVVSNAVLPSADGASSGLSGRVIEPLSVMGVGSWPRPRWLMRALHEYLQGRMTEEEFQETADDAVKLAVAQQTQAGVHVITDGEQRRDNYSSFVGKRLDNCQLIPLVDLLPLVDDAEDFARKLNSLDVPADKVRHPAVFGKLKRTRPLAVHELKFLQGLSSRPAKIALPGPYLLSRTMWMECITEKAYQSREELAGDIVSVLREELAELLRAGASIVQFDEPVLTEVVFGKPASGSTFMCGALSEKASPEKELAFATELINAVVAGFSKDRIAVHVCRGNWTPDESAALEGSYEVLLPVLNHINVGTLFLEYCTPRAGDLSVLARLPEDVRVGLGVVNPKSPHVESVDEVVARVRRAEAFIDRERLLLNPDCGFATFADNPVTSAEAAVGKLASMVAATQVLKQ